MEKENKNQSNNTCDSLMEKKEIDKVDLSELKSLVDKNPILTYEDGDYIEKNQDVIIFYNKNGYPKAIEEIDPENNFNVSVKRNEKGELIYISMWKKDIVISNIFKDKDD